MNANAGLAEHAALDQFVVEKSRVGRDSTVRHVSPDDRSPEHGCAGRTCRHPNEAQTTGKCTLPVAQIAERANIGRAKTRSAIRLAEGLGLIAIEETPDRKRGAPGPAVEQPRSLDVPAQRRRFAS